MRTLLSLLIAFGFAALPEGSVAAAVPQITVSERGAASRQPTYFWESDFLTGNGRMGAVYFGNPGDETVVMSQCRLFLPLGSAEVVPNIGQSLPELRKTIREKGYLRAMTFMEEKAKAAGWPGFLENTDPYHPAFFLKINAATGPARDYLRTEDFQTGEVTVQWNAAGRSYQRRLLISRPDNVAVLSLSSGKLSCDLAVPPIDPTAQALLEKIYDGSRYMILCATGECPPNLQGIWTGTWQPAWFGDYTLDTNLELAIAHTLSTGTPKLLQGYFISLTPRWPTGASTRGTSTAHGASWRPPASQTWVWRPLGAAAFTAVSGPVVPAGWHTGTSTTTATPATAVSSATERFPS